MATYRCLVRGENFRLEVNEERRLHGFYTTRWVEAENPDSAEEVVVSLLKQESILQKPDWHDGSGPAAMMFVEEIEEAEGYCIGPNQGFSFFLEEDQEPPSP
jgi:hypothetical protein